MNAKKKLVAGLMAAIMTVSVCGCGTTPSNNTPEGSGGSAKPGASVSTGSGAKVQISVAGSGTVDGTDTGDCFYEYQEQLQNKENAEVEVVYYFDGKMGSDADIIQSVQKGNLDVMTGSPSGIVSMVPEVAIVDIPGLFSSVENCNEVLKGDLYDNIQPYFADKGLYLLSWTCTGFRQLSSNKPIESAADINKLNIRTMENVYHMNYWRALGANPTPLSWSEVYISLEQSLIDAQENPIDTFLGSNLYEVQNYFILTYHVPFIETLVMNLNKWNSLTESQQADLKEWATGMHGEMTNRLVKSFDQKLEKLASEHNVTVIKFNDADLDVMKSANTDVISMMKENVSPDLVDSYVSLAQKAEAK